MRKWIASVLAALLCFLCSCGRASFDSACARAGELVASWDEATLNLYRYEGRAIEYDGHEGYMVVMTLDGGAFSSDYTQERYQSMETAASCVSGMEAQLERCFGAFKDVYIIVLVCDSGGSALYTFVNGEMQ